MAFGCNDAVKISDDEESTAGSGGGDADGGGDDGAGGDGSDGSCSDDAGCGAGQICEADECIDGDRNNSVDEAESLLFTDPSDEASRIRGILNPIYDQDYYAIQADGGEFVRISTYTDEEDETRDTVVTLLQDNGKVITYANGHAAGGGVSDADSVVYGYLPTEGTYYVLVEDDATFFGEGEPEGARDYVYDLQMVQWGRRTFEPDSFSEPNESIDMTTASSWFARGVLLEESGDLDYVSLDFQLDGHDLFLDGNYDLEGSDADPRVRLLDARTGEVLRDKRQNGLAGSVWFPDLPRGEYVVELSDAAGGGGAAHWFYLHAIARENEDSYAWETEVNDSLASAEVAAQEELETSSGNLYRVSRLQGLADSVGDEDWFQIESPYDDGRFVVCLNSTWYGSTTAPTVELYDSSGTLMAGVDGETDSAIEPTAELANLDVPTGTYYVRVAHPEGVGGTAGDWYRMVTYVASFNVNDYACP
jgi:hypothetical protein